MPTIVAGIHSHEIHSLSANHSAAPSHGTRDQTPDEGCSDRIDPVYDQVGQQPTNWKADENCHRPRPQTTRNRTPIVSEYRHFGDLCPRHRSGGFLGHPRGVTFDVNVGQPVQP